MKFKKKKEKKKVGKEQPGEQHMVMEPIHGLLEP